MISADRASLPQAGISALEPLPSIDLTALIDIIFIVLVFLLLTANSRLMSLPVEVPQSPSSAITAVEPKESIAINILASTPHWALNGETYTDLHAFSSAFEELLKRHPQASIVIAADKAAPVEPLMQLLALLQGNAISQTQILMEH